MSRSRIVNTSFITVVIGALAFAYLNEIGAIDAMLPIAVRAATSKDVSIGKHLGEPTRNIAVVVGAFHRDERLDANLYLVRHGKSQQIADYSSFRGTVRGGSIWVQSNIIVALVENETPKGTITNLITTGRSGGGGSLNALRHDFDTNFQKTFAGELELSQSYLLHIEGNQRSVASRAMTVEEFAKKNPTGKFLVVTVTWRRNQPNSNLE